MGFVPEMEEPSHCFSGPNRETKTFQCVQGERDAYSQYEQDGQTLQVETQQVR